MQSLATAILWSILLSTASAKCVLPVPDGGDEPPSKHNAAGRIVEVKGASILVTERGRARPLLLETTENTTYATIYGGWVRRDRLRPGQFVWLWYPGCTKPKTGLPQVAYLRLHSYDPSDQP